MAASIDIFDLPIKTLDGKPGSLGPYKDKTLLLVNVASKCGLTPQYKALEEVYDEFKEEGFEVLGFPCNDFAGQEPGTEAEIQSFCSTNYNVTFPLFAKIKVVGADKHPLYQFLTSQQTEPEGAGEVAWNFGKFLIDKDGQVVARFSPKTAPDAPEVLKAIEKATA